MKLTKAMKAQLLEYLRDVQQKGDYWGNREQFWKRHDKIVEWVKEQWTKRQQEEVNLRAGGACKHGAFSGYFCKKCLTAQEGV
jgi:hypothetical protein